MPRVTVYVTLKPTLLDAQGRTVESALHSLGYEEVGGLRIGRVIEMQLPDDDDASVRTRVASMCEKLLANPVTESYRIEIDGSGTSSSPAPSVSSSSSSLGEVMP